VPGGLFTDYVFNEMPEKAILRLEGPFGSFYMREDSNKPIIFVAGGTGFAPIKGLIEHMFHQNSARQMVLYWGVKTREDLYMPALPEAWASMHPNFTFIPVLSASAASDAWQGRTGFVHQAVLDDFAELSAHEVYCCGAPVMVDTASATFKERGLPADAFFADVFSYALQAPTT
jgi:CDP-4-dehydro-6-deoxyglucose reductase